HGVELRDVSALGREAEIADGDKPRAGGGVCRVGLRKFAASVAEGVELFDIAGLEPGLGPPPVTQAKLECPVPLPIQAAVRQAGDAIGAVGLESVGALRVCSDDHRGEANGDRRAHLVFAPKIDGIEKGLASSEIRPRPIASTAFDMRPLRPRMASAWETRR